MNQDLSSLPTSRDEALRVGAKFYFTGKPCKRGEASKRRSSDARCQCNRCLDLRVSYNRTYYSENKDRLLDYNEEYREANRENRLARKKEHYQENKGALVLKAKNHRESNRLEISARRKMSYATNNVKELATAERYRNRNRSALSYAGRLRYKENPKVAKASAQKRRAAKKYRVPVWYGELDRFVVSEAIELSLIRLVSTGIKWHVDHMIPLCGVGASGLHCYNNIQVIPSRMNLKKKNKIVLTEPGQWINAL